jgi:hypothetical protein
VVSILHLWKKVFELLKKVLHGVVGGVAVNLLSV